MTAEPVIRRVRSEAMRKADRRWRATRKADAAFVLSAGKGKRLVLVRLVEPGSELVPFEDTVARLVAALNEMESAK